MGGGGFPNGPDTYDDLLKGGKKIREKTGHPIGVGLSQELDTSMAMRAILWSFGGAEQDEAGNVTINSKQTIEALKYVKELYQQTKTPEVFTWTPPSNNQAMLAGRVSFVDERHLDHAAVRAREAARSTPRSWSAPR